MENVEIRATVKGALVSGTFPLVSVQSDTFIVRHPDYGLVRLPKAAAVSSSNYMASHNEINSDIKNRFAVLDRMIDGVISKNIRALIVSGAPGIGKTHNIDTKLTHAKNAGKVGKYLSNKGTISPIGLYILLHQHRNPGDVLVIDDCDSIFEQLDAINILKTALDTGEKRWISYAKEAYGLVEKGIPSRFEYRGSMIFASNIDFDKAVEGGGKMVPHLEALMSRSIYVDLGVHSKQAKLVRVEQVCRETDMLKKLGLSEGDVSSLIEWIKCNVDSLRSLSLRTAAQLASLMKTSDDWRLDAAVALLKPRRV